MSLLEISEDTLRIDDVWPRKQFDVRQSEKDLGTKVVRGGEIGRLSNLPCSLAGILHFSVRT